MKQINDHWAYQPGEHFRYNAGLLSCKGLAFLIDPGMTLKEISGIKEFLVNSSLKCEGIILTHFHWDHILGANCFGRVDIIAHQRFPGEQNAHLQGSFRAIENWAAETNEDALTPEELPIPDRLCEDGTLLCLGDSNPVIIHTPGHTGDHISIFEESSGVLWAGDVLSDVEIPFISQSIVDFLGTLEKISRLKVTTIIPGHGSPTRDHAEARKRVDEDLEYLNRLRDSVDIAVRQGASMEETVRRCHEIPIRFSDDNLQAHEWNIEGAYQELGGISSTKPAGWEKE